MVPCALAAEQELPYRHVGAVEQLVRQLVRRRVHLRLFRDDGCGQVQESLLPLCRAFADRKAGPAGELGDEAEALGGPSGSVCGGFLVAASARRSGCRH
eukprot:COSAG06_NODE_130_length_22547_cov_24.796418_6_plen_99_part_00